MDSWQNSLWRFIFPPQTSRINENKIQRLPLCGRRPSFFLDVFLNTQKTNGLRLLIFFGFGQSIHALHLQTPSVCFTQTPSLISAALQFLAFGTVVRAFLHRITTKSHLHCAHHCLFTVDLVHGYEIFPKHGILRVPAHQITCFWLSSAQILVQKRPFSVDASANNSYIRADT